MPCQAAVRPISLDRGPRAAAMIPEYSRTKGPAAAVDGDAAVKGSKGCVVERGLLRHNAGQCCTLLDLLAGDVGQRALLAAAGVGGYPEVPGAPREVGKRVTRQAYIGDLHGLGQAIAGGTVVDPVTGQVRQRRAVGVTGRGVQFTVAEPFDIWLTAMEKAVSDALAVPSLTEITIFE